MNFRWVAPDGTELTFSRDATDYRLTKKYDGIATVPVAHYTQKAPYQDGVTYLESRLTPRTISFEIMIMAPDLQTLQSRIKALASAFKPTAEGHLYYTNEAGEEYWIKCIGNNTPTFSMGDRSREYQRAFITLTAFDPFWYGSRNTAHISTISTAFFPFDVSKNFLGWQGSTITANNNGDMVSDVTITIFGECENPKLTNSTTGEYIELDISMNASDTFKITTAFGNKTATYTPISTGVAVTGFPYILSGSILWRLDPGPNTIVLTDTSFASGTYITIDWYDRYVAVS